MWRQFYHVKLAPVKGFLQKQQNLFCCCKATPGAPNYSTHTLGCQQIYLLLQANNLNFSLACGGGLLYNCLC